MSQQFSQKRKRNPLSAKSTKNVSSTPPYRRRYSKTQYSHRSVAFRLRSPYPFFKTGNARTLQHRTPKQSSELRARNTMEEELRCPACKQFYINPVLLPCFHALCLHCAVHLQLPATAAVAVANNNNAASSSHSAASSENAESVASGSSGGDYQESDKLSILSETDSGVVCTSRPNSYVGTPNGLLFPTALSLTCPVCQKLVYFDENGAYNLPKYRVMQSVVDKYGEAKNLTLKCQLCENEPANEATVMCEQCEVLYCESCRESCHPARGPLAKHNLTTPKRGMQLGIKGRDGKCPEHEEENLNMFCLVCKIAICPVCLMDMRHASHDVQALVLMCKAQKVRTTFQSLLRLGLTLDEGHTL